jgi:hypothetical protein
MRVFMLRGSIVATVTRYYTQLIARGRPPAADVLRDFKKVGAAAALERDEFWDPGWGNLIKKANAVTGR